MTTQKHWTEMLLVLDNTEVLQQERFFVKHQKYIKLHILSCLLGSCMQSLQQSPQHLGDGHNALYVFGCFTLHVNRCGVGQGTTVHPILLGLDGIAQVCLPQQVAFLDFQRRPKAHGRHMCRLGSAIAADKLGEHPK